MRAASGLGVLLPILVRTPIHLSPRLCAEESDDASTVLPPRTEEAAALLQHVREPGASSVFGRAWLGVLQHAAADVEAQPSDESSGNLQLRIAEVRAREHARRVVADCLALSAERGFADASLRPLGAAREIAPGVELPADAATLERACKHFPGQSARQVRAIVLENAPSAEPDVTGKFDRLQAARLYMGHAQFGYFVSQIFRG